MSSECDRDYYAALCQYQHSSDICKACGKRGGEHYTDNKSWCYSPQQRAKNADWKFHTYFVYELSQLEVFIDVGL